MSSSENTAFRIASPPGNTGTRSGFSPARSARVHVAGLDEVGAQAVEPRRRDDVLAEAVLPDDFRERAHGAGGSQRLLPVAASESRHDRLQLVAGGEFGLLHRALRDLAVLEEAQAVGDAAHEQALQLLRPVARADDELGRAAADVHHQPLFARGGQLVRDPEIDQPRFFAARHHLDGEAQRRLGLPEESRRILRHAQGVGADGPHARACRSRATARRSASGRRAPAPGYASSMRLSLVRPAPSRTGSRRESRG